MINRLALSVLAAAILLTAGCDKVSPSDTGQKPMTQHQTIATRPLCVGRFLIDVPVDAKVVWTDTRTSLTGAIKMEGVLSEKAFASRMRNEQERIARTTTSDGTSLLKDAQEFEDQQGRIFVFRDSPSNDLYYDVKAFALKTGTLFSFHDQAEDDKLPLAIRDVTKGFALLAPRDTWSIPTEPGFCFDNGFLPGKDTTFEATGVQLTFKEYPGLMIALETQTNDQGAFPGPDLITRTEEGQGVVEPHQRATMLRKNAKRSIGDRAGQEVMLKRQVESALRLTGYLEVNAEPGRIDAPGIVFSLGLTPSDSMAERFPSEAEVTGLWDTIIQSLRLRPGAIVDPVFKTTD
jgi:hypothetical protein